MTDTLSIHQSLLMPASKGVKATPVDVDGYVVFNNDSLSNVLDGIKGALTEQSNSLDTLCTIVDDISEYGVGYSDALCHIFFPLIIALFAFAFPFLFTVISHINNKYKSENITKMFSSELSYRCFMIGAIICASFLFVSGALSLFGQYGTYNVLKDCINWIGVVIAGGYSAIIIWFVYTCVSYNNPSKVLSRIGEKCELETTSLFKNTIRADKRIYVGEYNRIYRYIELCKYAVSKQDYNLFNNVLLKVNGLKHKKDNLDYLNFDFYDGVLDSYLFGKSNAMMEDSLMMYWFMTFKKSEIPNLGLVFRMFARIVYAVQQGRASLFENYLLKSKYGYNFIVNLPIVSYVRGDDIKEQMEMDEKRRSTWRELCEVHNMALAHLFSLGYYEVVRIVQLGDNTGYDRLIPGTGIEVLKMFARCKEKQNPDGTFNLWPCEKVIGTNTDPNMLEKYAAIMLLLSSAELYEELRPISPKHLGLIKESKSEIVKYGNLWKGEMKLKGLFPQIEDEDIEVLTDGIIKWFEGTEYKELVDKDNVEKKCLIARIIDALSNKEQKKNIKNVDIYSKPLLDSEKEKIEYGFRNMINGNRGYVFDNLYSVEEKGKTECYEMGAYTFTMFKQHLVEVRSEDYYFEWFGDTRIYQSRYVYMLLRAMQSMIINDESIEYGGIRRYLRGYLGDKGEDYMIIEIGGSSLLLMTLDKGDKERVGFGDMRVMKASYKSYDFNVGWYLNDIAKIADFNDTIIIIKKTDLPYVCSSSSELGPTVDFADVSDKDAGKAEVRVTVNPNLLMKYSKETVIKRVKVERPWRR